MNKDEFNKFFRYISAATNDTNPSPEKIAVYWDALNDLDFTVAMTAARKIIATLENPFLPMPAVFRKECANMTSPTIPNFADAYKEVIRAISNFGSYRQTEALASLSPLARKTVENMGWKEICLSEEPDVIRGQFRKAYEAIEQRELIDARTPQALKEIAASIQERSQLKQIAKTSPEELEKLYL